MFILPGLIILSFMFRTVIKDMGFIIILHIKTQVLTEENQGLEVILKSIYNYSKLPFIV